MKQNQKKNRRPAIFGCTLAAVLMLGGCAMGGASGSKTVKGIKALDKGEYQQALQLFQEAVQKDEQLMLAYRGLGMAYMGLAQYDEAEAAFKDALENADERQPENVEDVQLYLATVQYRKGDYENTVSTCDAILENNQEGNADAYFLRGAGYLHDGQTEEAAADFEAAVALQPEDYDLYLNIYQCYKDTNLSGLGSSYLQRALDIQGEDQEHQYNRGRVYYYLENYEMAQSCLIGPVEEEYEPAMHLIAQVYLAMDDCEHAQAIYEQIQKKYGATSQTYNGLAMCALKRDDFDGALSYIEQGLQQDDNSDKKELYFNEIVAYERKLDFETAKTKAQEFVQHYPSDEAGQKEWTFLSTRN